MDNTKDIRDLNTSVKSLSQSVIDFSTSFTRPANITAYAAEDVVGPATAALLSFSAVGGEGIVAGSKYYVKSLRVATDNATVTFGSFRLYLTTVSQTAIADNSPQTLLYANRAGVVGYIDFSLSTGGTGSDSAEAYVTGIDMPITTSTSAIYGYLVAKAAYVPASGQQFYLRLSLQPYK